MFQQALFEHFKSLSAWPHAILLHGAEGSGKFELSQSLAHELLQISSPTDFHPDLFVIESEPNQSIKIDAIREMKSKILQTAHQGSHRVVIIHRAENMTTQAANALLKILEEPPEKRTFILTAQALSKIPATVLSRCQHYYCRIPVAETSDIALQDALTWSDGAMGKAKRLVSDDLLKDNDWLIGATHQLLEDRSLWKLTLDNLSKLDAHFLADCLQTMLIDLICCKNGLVIRRNLAQKEILKAIGAKLDIARLFHYYGLIIEQKRYNQIKLESLLAELLIDAGTW